MYKVLLDKRALPLDFLDLVFDNLERCSVEKFCLYIRGIRTNHEQRVKGVDLTYLLTEAEQKYQEIDDWNGEKVESGFNADDNVCWNCGSPDHYARDCPLSDCHAGQGRREHGRGRGSGRGRGNQRGGRRGHETIVPRMIVCNRQRKMKQGLASLEMLWNIGAELVGAGQTIPPTSTQSWLITPRTQVERFL